MAEWGLKHAEGMSLRYDEIAAFETLFRGTFLFGISWGERWFVCVGGLFGDFITLWELRLTDIIHYYL